MLKVISSNESGCGTRKESVVTCQGTGVRFERHMRFQCYQSTTPYDRKQLIKTPNLIRIAYEILVSESEPSLGPLKLTFRHWKCSLSLSNLLTNQ
jgi:hypothetical protein